MAGNNPFGRTWTTMRARRAADTPRREAARAAYDAVRPLKGRPDPEVRAALVRQLAERDVGDLSPAQIDALLGAVQTSPNRVAFGLLRNQARWLHGLWTELKQNAAPS